MSKKRVLDILGTSLSVAYKAAVVVHEVDMVVNHSLACGCYRSCRCWRSRPVFAPVVVVERRREYNIFEDIFAPRVTTLRDSFREDMRRDEREQERAAQRRHELELARIRATPVAAPVHEPREVMSEVRAEARAEARAETRRTERKVEDLEAEVAKLRRELLGK